MGPLGDDGFNTDAMCLQATATYIDAVANENDDGDPRTDDEETFIDERKDAGHSDGMRVEPKTRGNAAPTFDKEDANDDLVMEDGTAGNPFMRSVDENDKNATVGSPLNSADADGDDMIHTLGGADAASFTIDSDSGQISVKGELDYETKSMYMVEVIATDPSLAKGTAMVMITVNDEDDPGVVMGDDPADYAENGDGPVASFTATDQDGDPIEWSLNGADEMDFEISDDGELTFKTSPNFEAPGDADTDNVYNVTIVANKGTKKVTVTVTDVEETGSVSLSQVQPQVEISVQASRSDPDGMVTATTWQWAKSTDMNSWTDIDGATGAIYMPQDADLNYYLRATATYTDRRGPGKTASMVSEYPVEAETAANAAPNFPEEDSNPSGNREGERSGC